MFLGFFFFLGADFVAAHRIVWYESDASRGASGFELAIDEVLSLLNGAMRDLGCAMAIAH